jgi:hypothetical protein
LRAFHLVGEFLGPLRILASQSDAKRRVEVIQKHGSQLRNAITIGIAQQRFVGHVMSMVLGHQSSTGSSVARQ